MPGVAGIVSQRCFLCTRGTAFRYKTAIQASGFPVLFYGRRIFDNCFIPLRFQAVDDSGFGTSPRRGTGPPVLGTLGRRDGLAFEEKPKCNVLADAIKGQSETALSMKYTFRAVSPARSRIDLAGTSFHLTRYPNFCHSACRSVH